MAKTVKINGVTYTDVSEVKLPLASDASSYALFPDTSGDTAAAGDILSGKTAHAKDAAVTGTMADNGAVAGTISAKAGAYTIPAGHHSGSGTVSIAAAEQAKLISGNIRAGVTVLGVSGSAGVVDTAGATAAPGQLLSGYTAYVNGALVTGALTVPALSLTDGVLTVS